MNTLSWKHTRPDSKLDFGVVGVFISFSNPRFQIGEVEKENGAQQTENKLEEAGRQVKASNISWKEI